MLFVARSDRGLNTEGGSVRVKSKRKFSVAVAGATGLVGGEMLKVLHEREFPLSDLFLLASERSAGEPMEIEEIAYEVQELRENSFEKLKPDFVLFGTSAELSAKFVPLASQAGAISIDNSSHFRMKPEVPLIVPEVNVEKIFEAKKNRMIANPNCSTIQLVVCLKPLHEAARIKRVVASTYQSVSGAGAEALQELENQVSGLFSHGEITKKVFPHQIAFNCLPHIDQFLENGFTKEEMKIINESRKILSLPNLRITATAVRVPTFISHSESVNIEFETELSAEDAREILAESGVHVLDNPSKNLYPLGFEVAGQDGVFVGRIRRDESVEHGLHLWIVADNLRKGAATNAVQIAEACIEKGLIS